MSTAVFHHSKSKEANVHLRRLHSTPNSTYSSTSTLPAYTALDSLPSEKSTLYLEQDTKSINSTSSTVDANSEIFIPTRVLEIKARGKKRLSAPSPCKEQEVPICDIEGNVRYLAIRPKRSSGNCTLFASPSDSSYSSETALAETTYFFGPGRSPIIKLLDDAVEDHDGEEITLKSNCLTSRTVVFESRKWGRFQWRYASKKERQAYKSEDEDRTREVPSSLLLLEKFVGEGKMQEKVLVARLIRGEGTRTPGTRTSCSGNGGRLEMADTQLVNEVMVVSTCLSMLKKEIDRMRTIQIIVICCVVSGAC